MSNFPYAPILVCLMLMAFGLPGGEQAQVEEIEDRLWTDSNDGYGPINYTNEHTTATITSEGRSATITMPGGHVYDRPLPLVVGLHGYSSSGSFNAWWMSLYDSVHQNEHLLLTPDGTMNIIGMRFWNATEACCNLFGTEVDDVAFLAGLIDQAIQNYGADPEGVVLIGHSNGAFMSHRMACDQGGIIESIVSLNGATWDDFANDCPDTGRPNILHVHSSLDSVIQYAGGSITGGNPYPSAPQSTAFWADRSGCDASWTDLGSIDLTGSDGAPETDNLEHLNCADGNRVAHWRINDGTHAPPLNDPGWADESLSLALEDFSRDSDGDGYRDDVDAFIYNPNEWADADGDKVGDNTDQCDDDPTGWIDSDGDGVCVPSDAFPNNPYEWSDADGDGTGDNSDADDDNDGVADYYDAFPLDANETVDTDGDGVGDNADTDDDNDGWDDAQDAFPLDPDEHSDIDGDGVGDNADADDDGDGWSDADELSCQTDPVDGADVPTDTDSDWECDLLDDDDDGDGDPDGDDQFPLDSTEWDDSDGDGVGDNADAFPEDAAETLDSDADGGGVNGDKFPQDPLEWADSDGDGGGDNADSFPDDSSEWADSDGDGVGDNADVFPDDPSEWADTDGDGVGDTQDAFPDDPSEWVDSDGDGVGDNQDAFPGDASETVDTDGDGFGDNMDAFPYSLREWIDTDGDGVGDNSDAFPMDPTESMDSDGDGVGDRADFFPNDATKWEEEKMDTMPLILAAVVVVLLGLVVYSGRKK